MRFLAVVGEWRAAIHSVVGHRDAASHAVAGTESPLRLIDLFKVHHGSTREATCGDAPSELASRSSERPTAALTGPWTLLNGGDRMGR
jgi:hypothetical protein